VTNSEAAPNASRRTIESVCANNQIETSRTRLLKRHIHSRFVLAERLDGITEDVIGVVCTGAMEDSGEIAACNLDVFGYDRRSQHIDVDPRDPPPGRVQGGSFPAIGSGFPELRQDIHPLGHVDGGPTHIDRAAARAKRATAFHDRHGMTVARQPMCKGTTRDAGARDWHLELCRRGPVAGRSDGFVCPHGVIISHLRQADSSTIPAVPLGRRPGCKWRPFPPALPSQQAHRRTLAKAGT
jgi:hypothetical protein